MLEYTTDLWYNPPHVLSALTPCTSFQIRPSHFEALKWKLKYKRRSSSVNMLRKSRGLVKIP